MKQAKIWQSFSIGYFCTTFNENQKGSGFFCRFGMEWPLCVCMCVGSHRKKPTHGDKLCWQDKVKQDLKKTFSDPKSIAVYQGPGAQTWVLREHCSCWWQVLDWVYLCLSVLYFTVSFWNLMTEVSHYSTKNGHCYLCS